MPLPTRPTMLDGNEVALRQEVADGESIDFVAGSEPWVTIELADGAQLKYRSTIASVTRISDDPLNGKPRYFVQHQDVVRVVKQPENARPKDVPYMNMNTGNPEVRKR